VSGIAAFSPDVEMTICYPESGVFTLGAEHVITQKYGEGKERMPVSPGNILQCEKHHAFFPGFIQ